MKGHIVYSLGFKNLNEQQSKDILKNIDKIQKQDLLTKIEFLGFVFINNPLKK